MKYFSMFTGIGGFELGIRQAYTKLSLEREKPFEEECEQGRKRTANQQHIQLCSGGEPAPLCVGYSEINKYAIQVFEKHFGGIKNYGDCTRINPEELPDFNMLCGGFPCQSFSIAGKRRGFEDTRGTLFFDIARIIQAKRPEIVWLENVKGLLNHDKGQTFRIILETLDNLGYDVEWQVLNSKHFGVPQNRERVFIIGHLRGKPRQQIFPLRNSMQKPFTKGSQRLECIYDGDYQDKRIYGKNGICPTIPTSGDHIPFIEDKMMIRCLTPVEYERLQGFPDGWTEGLSDTQRYKCLGNAVTVNVIEAIAERLLEEKR